MAANHWQTAIDVHQAHFPDAGHDCADISQADPIDQPHPTVCASDDRHALVVPMRRNGRAATLDQPTPTVTAGGTHHGLLMRNNGTTAGEDWATTPTDQPARTMTTKGHQSGAGSLAGARSGVCC